MVKTNMKRVLAILTIATLAINSTYAATQIGTWSVTWTTTFDSSVIWDDVIPWFATGAVSWIVVTAKVLPILNMVISSGAIDLWTLSPTDYATWSVDIEVGTNAANWVNVTAKSDTAWLGSVANGSVINNLTVDWIAESYKFSSALNAAADSTVTWYTQVSNLDTEVNDSSEHTIYQTVKPESSNWLDDFKLFVSAKIDEQTPAWIDYKDTITVTVVWNF